MIRSRPIGLNGPALPTGPGLPRPARPEAARCRRGRAGSVAILACAAVTLLGGAAAPLGPEGRRRLEDRDRHVRDAMRLRGEGELAEAVAAMEQAWITETGIYGPGRQPSSFTWMWLTRFQGEHGDFATARARLREVAESVAAARGAGHWQVVEARRNLAELATVEGWGPERRERFRLSGRRSSQVVGLIAEGKYADALKLADELQEIRKELWGQEHPDFAISLFSHGSIDLLLGNLDRAEQEIGRALRMHHKILGRVHPYAVDCLDQLAAVAIARERFGDAARFRRESLDACWAVFGEESTEYAGAAWRLGESLSVSNEHLDAAIFHRLAANVFARVEGTEGPNYLEAIERLGVDFLNAEQPDRAEPRIRQALGLARALHGEESREVGHELLLLGLVLRAKGDRAGAIDFLRRSRDLLARTTNREDSDYLTSIEGLALTYQEIDDPAHAEPLRREVQELRRSMQDKGR